MIDVTTAQHAAKTINQNGILFLTSFDQSRSFSLTYTYTAATTAQIRTQALMIPINQRAHPEQQPILM